jgi:hypothetical protein
MPRASGQLGWGGERYFEGSTRRRRGERRGGTNESNGASVVARRLMP